MKPQFMMEESGMRASLPVGLQWQVQEMDWVLPGGARNATISARLQNPDLIHPNLYKNWLGKAVGIYDPQGERIWHGWLAQIDLQVGRVNYRWDLEQVYSKVIARYPQVSAVLDPYHAWAYGDWMKDEVLMSEIGAKEQLISLTYGNASSAGQVARQTLNQHKIISQRAMLQPESTEGVQLRIQARGWWQRLAWRLDESRQGILAHLPGGKSQQLFGLSGNAKLAQSFLCTTDDFALGQICLRMALIGAPQDEVIVKICSDASGQPGATLASSSLPAMQLQGGWQWLVWELDPPLSLNINQQYWFIVERSTSLDALNHYSIESDDGRGYANGVCLRWNGSGWLNTGQDLRFALLAVAESTQLIRDVGQLAVGDGVLKGVQVRQESGLFLPYWRAPEMTRLERMEEWLQLGCSDQSPLNALVNAEGILEVFNLPRGNATPLQLDRHGRLMAMAGAELALPLDLLGQTFHFPQEIQSQPQVLRGLRWTPEGGLFPLITD